MWTEYKEIKKSRGRYSIKKANGIKTKGINIDRNVIEIVDFNI